MTSTRRLAALFASLLVTSLAFAQSPGSISGTARIAGGGSASNATVTIVQLNRLVRSSPEGEFRFDQVPPGDYLVLIESPRYGSAVREVTVAPGTDTRLELELDLTVHREQIIVTASPEARSANDTYQPTDVLSHEELALRLESTLGETLAKSPGVSSTYFGPAASRPVIRGFGGDRIRVLEEGLGTGDASNVSPDHAVSYDPASAEQIEIVRGPATLLYGSNAVGGVVNVIDSRIPRSSPGVPITGTVDLGYGTAANERSGSLRLEGAAGELAWHLGHHRRESGDVEIPGPAEAHDEEEEGEEHEEFTGKLLNSALESDGTTVGASWISERGLVGVSWSGYDSLYGLPVHLHHEHEGESAGIRPRQEEEHEEDIRIDMKQRRWDARAEWLEPFAIFRSMRLRFGIADYQHTELEGEEIGTLFENESWEARIEAPHRAVGAMRGSIGAQFSKRDFAAAGAEAFVPPSTTENRALFLFEETTHETRRGRIHFQFGARWESSDVSAIPIEHEHEPTPVERLQLDTPVDLDFAGLSGSLGSVWHFAPDYSMSASVSRAVRAPTAEELFSNGPHLATFTFEVGNLELAEEVSVGADVGVRKEAGPITGEIHLFFNRFDGYIYQVPTGEEEDELPVFVFRQDDARFHGIEAHADVELWHSEPNHLDLELSGDWVSAELTGGTPLPRIPPMRLGVGLRYRGPRFWGLAEVRRTFEQDRVAPLEEPTDSWTMLNAAIGTRLFAGDTIHDLILKGTNLTDELARNHVSPLKDLVPLPGRNVSLSYRVTF
ncbi:MAG TPA: TonB-dependent receptor [Thermoanaerobaculia bacterium]|nr:TonB-dependent receptor [Thermoanaerobaculia bacterium]